MVSTFTTDQDGITTGGRTEMFVGGDVDNSPTHAIAIHWQDGIIGENGQNGAFVEDVLEAARQRIQFSTLGSFGAGRTP